MVAVEARQDMLEMVAVEDMVLVHTRMDLLALEVVGVVHHLVVLLLAVAVLEDMVKAVMEPVEQIMVVAGEVPVKVVVAVQMEQVQEIVPAEIMVEAPDITRILVEMPPFKSFGVLEELIQAHKPVYQMTVKGD
jgi:predicted sugar kinase